MRDASDLVCTETGKVRVLSKRCDTCIFWPDDRMSLGAESTERVKSENLRRGTLLTCHSTLPYGANPDFGPAACHGFWTAGGRHTLAGRIALLIGIIKVSPPEPGSKEEPA